MDIIKDNPFWEEKRVYSKAEAWIYLQENDISIRETSKLFGWSTTKLYAFLKEIKNTLKKTAKKTPPKAITTSNTNTSLEVIKNKNTVKNTPKKTLEDRKKEFGEKLIPFVNKYGREMIREFFNYWTEHNEEGRLMAFEKTKTKTFSIPNRLITWNRNNKDKIIRVGNIHPINDYKSSEKVYEEF